jgi:hypothetical protein
MLEWEDHNELILAGGASNQIGDMSAGRRHTWHISGILREPRSARLGSDTDEGVTMSYPTYAPPRPAPAYWQPRRSAPPSVHVIAFLHYLGGAVALAAAAVVAFLAVQFDRDAQIQAELANIEPELADLAGPALGIVAGVLAFFALIALFIGRKLQRGRQWARVLVLILCALSVAGVVFTIVAGGSATYNLGSLFFPVLTLILLNTRAARSWFGHRTW